MSAAPDQWFRWRTAVTNGTRIETERGNPASGFYKQTTGEPAPRDVEAICICRDGDTLQCFRNVYGDGSRMDADQIDELFGKVCIYPISHEVYQAVAERGEAFPPEYGIGGRLTMKDQQAGVAWTPEYGRKRLGLTDGQATPTQQHPADTQNPVAAPAPTGHTFAGERTPDILMLEEVSALGATVKTWLAGIGGAPRDKAEADIAADFKTKFGALEKKADKAREDEKAPHWQQCKDIEAKWKRPITDAKRSKERCGELMLQGMDAENARRQAEADAANARAAAEAAKNAERFDAPVTAPAPVVAEMVTSAGNMRTVAPRERFAFVVTDAREYLRHLLTLNTDLPTEIVEGAEKAARRRAEEAPGVEKRTERRAA